MSNFFNMLAMGPAHLFVMFCYMSKKGINIIPEYFYRTDLSKKSFPDAIRFIEGLGVTVKIVQCKVDLQYATSTLFLSAIHSENTSRVCLVERHPGSQVSIMTGYNESLEINANDKSIDFLPFIIEMTGEPDIDEKAKFGSWLEKFMSQAEFFKNNHRKLQDSMLSFELCDRIISLCSSKTHASRIFGRQGVKEYSTKRSSSDCLVDDKELSEYVHSIAKDILDDHVFSLEQPVFVAYGREQSYRPHFDTSVREMPIRRKTVIVYLNDDFDGGETEFTVLGDVIKPKKGSVLLFSNIVNSELSLFSMHAGLPVRAGSKYICNVWTD